MASEDSKLGKKLAEEIAKQQKNFEDASPEDPLTMKAFDMQIQLWTWIKEQEPTWQKELDSGKINRETVEKYIREKARTLNFLQYKKFFDPNYRPGMDIDSFILDYFNKNINHSNIVQKLQQDKLYEKNRRTKNKDNADPYKRVSENLVKNNYQILDDDSIKIFRENDNAGALMEKQGTPAEKAAYAVYLSKMYQAEADRLMTEKGVSEVAKADAIKMAKKYQDETDRVMIKNGTTAQRLAYATTRAKQDPEYQAEDLFKKPSFPSKEKIKSVLSDIAKKKGQQLRAEDAIIQTSIINQINIIETTFYHAFQMKVAAEKAHSKYSNEIKKLEDKLGTATPNESMEMTKKIAQLKKERDTLKNPINELNGFLTQPWELDKLVEEKMQGKPHEYDKSQARKEINQERLEKLQIIALNTSKAVDAVKEKRFMQGLIDVLKAWFDYFKTHAEKAVSTIETGIGDIESRAKYYNTMPGFESYKEKKEKDAKSEKAATPDPAAKNMEDNKSKPNAP